MYAVRRIGQTDPGPTRPLAVDPAVAGDLFPRRHLEDIGVDHLIAFRRILFGPVFQNRADRGPPLPLQHYIVLLRAFVFDYTEIGLVPIQSVLRFCVTSPIGVTVMLFVLPGDIVKDIVPHLEEVFLVVEDGEPPSNALILPRSVGDDQRIVETFGRSRYFAAQIPDILHHPIVDQQLLSGIHLCNPLLHCRSLGNPLDWTL